MRTAAALALFGLLGAGAIVQGENEKRLFGIRLPSKAEPTKAAPAAPAPIDPEVSKLVLALGSESYRQREKAGKALEARGDKVLPDLRRAANGTESPEIARRLAVIIRRMDHERLVAPKRVSLSLKKKTAKEAFDAIAKQTGYKIQFDAGGIMMGNGSSTKHDFQFDKTPFWVAMDKIADAAGLSVNADYGDELVHVNNYSNSHNPHVSYAGPFRFVATGINSNRSVQLSGINRNGFQNRITENVSMSFQVYSEPKNPILGSLPTEVLVATDDTGASLVPHKDPNNRSYSNYYSNSYRGHNAYGNLNLVRGAKEATTIKTLKAKMGIILLAGVVPEIVIDNPLKTKKKSIAGRTAEMTFDSLSEANGQYTAVLTVKKLNPDPNNFDYNWSNSIWQKLELVDAAGKKYHTYGPNAINNNNGHSVQLTIPFHKNNRQGQQEKLGKPVKFVLNEWLQVTNEVTFEFKDVPLP